MIDLFLTNMQLFTIQDINWWTGVVWITCKLLCCFYQLFGLSFWWHPFTAEDPLVSKWCNDEFQKNLFQWRNKLIYSSRIVWGQLFIFGWTIPLKIILYSLYIRLQVKDLCKSYTVIMLFACMFRVRGIHSTFRWLTVWKWYVYNRILLLYLMEVFSYFLNALHNYQEQILSSCIRGNGSWWISNRVSRW